MSSKSEESKTVETHKMSYFRKFRLIFPHFKFSSISLIVTWMMYHLDILSDVLQMHSLEKNCHYWFLASSIGIVVISFLVTSIYVKHHFGVDWLKAVQ